MNVTRLSKQDICGFVVLYKYQVYQYFSYMHKHSKKDSAKRLMAKIASDENEARLFYKKYYDNIENDYAKDELDIIEPFYVSIFDEHIISIDKDVWEKDSLTLHTYNDVFDLFSEKSERFCSFLSTFLSKICQSIDTETQKIIAAFISKEKAYKTSIKLLVEKLLDDE